MFKSLFQKSFSCFTMFSIYVKIFLLNININHEKIFLSNNIYYNGIDDILKHNSKEKILNIIKFINNNNESLYKEFSSTGIYRNISLIHSGIFKDDLGFIFTSQSKYNNIDIINSNLLYMRKSTFVLPVIYKYAVFNNNFIHKTLYSNFSNKNMDYYYYYIYLKKYSKYIDIPVSILDDCNRYKIVTMDKSSLFNTYAFKANINLLKIENFCIQENISISTYENIYSNKENLIEILKHMSHI